MYFYCRSYNLFTLMLHETKVEVSLELLVWHKQDLTAFALKKTITKTTTPHFTVFRLLGTSRIILLQSLQLRYRWPISALVGGVVHAVPLSSGIGKLVRARHGNGRSFGSLNRLQHASFLALLAVGLLVPKKKEESHSKKNPFNKCIKFI